MDPFSITIGALGITEFAISRIDQLRRTIVALSEANEVLEEIDSNLQGIKRPLFALSELNVATSAAVKDLKNAGVPEAVNKCGDACNEFTQNLQEWTKHSNTVRLSFRDRFSVGIWNKEKLRTFRLQVQSCQATVQLAVASAQLIIQVRTEKMSDTHRVELKKQVQSLEAQVQKQLVSTNAQRSEAEAHKQELQRGANVDEEAVWETEKQLRLLEDEQVSCGVVHSQLQSERTGLSLGDISTLRNSRALVGIPQSAIGKINMRIGNVGTQDNSSTAAGVFNDQMDMKDFFKRSTGAS